MHPVLYCVTFSAMDSIPSTTLEFEPWFGMASSADHALACAADALPSSRAFAASAVRLRDVAGIVDHMTDYFAQSEFDLDRA
jgi:hypothetical protein